MDSHDRQYYCCGDCQALFSTLAALSKHKAKCTSGIADDHNLYAYDNKQQDIQSCHKSCTHIGTCPMILNTAKYLKLQQKGMQEVCIKRPQSLHKAKGNPDSCCTSTITSRTDQSEAGKSGGDMQPAVTQELQPFNELVCQEVVNVEEGFLVVQDVENNQVNINKDCSVFYDKGPIEDNIFSVHNAHSSNITYASSSSTIEAASIPANSNMDQVSAETSESLTMVYDGNQSKTVNVIIETQEIDISPRNGSNRLSKIINQIEGSLDQMPTKHPADEQNVVGYTKSNPLEIVPQVQNNKSLSDVATVAAKPAEPTGLSLFDEMKRFRKLVPSKTASGTVQSYVCDVCAWSTTHLGFFVRHLKSHNGTKPGSHWKCDKCDFTCSSKAQIKRHNDKHVKPFMCEFCSHTFARKMDLIRHLYIHSGELPFKCSHCDYRCRQHKSLSDHTKKHTGELLSCPVEGCNFTSIYKWAVTSHKLSKHTATKRFHCPQCNYKTSDSNSIMRHKRLHDGEKNFKCPVPLCPYRAVVKHDIVRHMRTHTKEKLYFCDRCSYSTSHASGLRLHMMNHLGVKPWQCIICGYNSLTRSKVLRHVKQTHRIQNSGEADQAVVNLGLKLDINIKEYKTPHEGSKFEAEDMSAIVYTVSEEVDAIEYIEAQDSGESEVVVTEGCGGLEAQQQLTSIVEQHVQAEEGNKTEDPNVVHVMQIPTDCLTEHTTMSHSEEQLTITSASNDDVDIQWQPDGGQHLVVDSNDIQLIEITTT